MFQCLNRPGRCGYPLMGCSGLIWGGGEEHGRAGKRGNTGKPRTAQDHNREHRKHRTIGGTGEPENMKNWKIAKNGKTGKHRKWTYNTNCEAIENGNYGPNLRNAYKWDNGDKQMHSHSRVEVLTEHCSSCTTFFNITVCTQCDEPGHTHCTLAKHHRLLHFC